MITDTINSIWASLRASQQGNRGKIRDMALFALFRDLAENIWEGRGRKTAGKIQSRSKYTRSNMLLDLWVESAHALTELKKIRFARYFLHEIFYVY